MTLQPAILTDTTLCTGCEECVEACRKEYRLGADRPRRWKEHIDDLSEVSSPLTRLRSLTRRMT